LTKRTAQKLDQSPQGLLVKQTEFLTGVKDTPFRPAEDLPHAIRETRGDLLVLKKAW